MSSNAESPAVAAVSGACVPSGAYAAYCDARMNPRHPAWGGEWAAAEAGATFTAVAAFGLDTGTSGIVLGSLLSLSGEGERDLLDGALRTVREMGTLGVATVAGMLHVGVSTGVRGRERSGLCGAIGLAGMIMAAWVVGCGGLEVAKDLHL